MINVDLIVPYLSPLLKHINFPSGANVKYQYWFPVWLFKKKLKKMGVNIRFLNFFDLKIKNLSEVVGFDSYTPNLLATFDRIKRNLRKKVDYILWFDQADTPNKTSFRLLKYVDRYFKRQMFRDLSLYRKEYYRARFHIDYYVRNYNLSTKDIAKKMDFPDPKYEHKLGLSWNFAYCDYRYSSLLTQYLYKLNRKGGLVYHLPSLDRNLMFSANFSMHQNYLIYFQRIKMYQFLKKKYKSFLNVSIGNVPRRDYKKNMRNSNAIFSPFGWGEPCFRDFEIYIAGAALIKPDMDHLQTWPDLYKKNETYIPLSWRIEDWDKETDEIFSDERKLLKIARNGQHQYKKIWTPEGKEKFCKRFIEMVTPN